MNVVLLEPTELGADGRAELEGRRFEHITGVLGKGVGDTVRVGVVGAALGEATLEAVDRASLRLRCTVSEAPPPKRPFTLVLALPRPPMLRRTLQNAAAMGVERIVLLHTRRVDKAFWGSKALEPEAVRENLLLGLEQAVDTVLPELEHAPKFRPFVEDRLPALASNSVVYVADPSATDRCPVDVDGDVVLVVGPEGGFIEFELELLRGAGCTMIGLGPRILRVETAVVALLARLGS